MGRGIAGCGAATFTGAKQGNRGKWSPERTIGRGRCGEQGAPPHRSSYWWSPAVAIGPVTVATGVVGGEGRVRRGLDPASTGLARLVEEGSCGDLGELGTDLAQICLELPDCVVHAGAPRCEIGDLGLERREHGLHAGHRGLHLVERLLDRQQRRSDTTTLDRRVRHLLLQIEIRHDRLEALRARRGQDEEAGTGNLIPNDTDLASRTS